MGWSSFLYLYQVGSNHGAGFKQRSRGQRARQRVIFLRKCRTSLNGLSLDLKWRCAFNKAGVAVGGQLERGVFGVVTMIGSIVLAFSG